MANTEVKLNNMNGTKLMLTVRLTKVFRLRLRLGLALFYLASWVIGAASVVNLEATDV